MTPHELMCFQNLSPALSIQIPTSGLRWPITGKLWFFPSLSGCIFTLYVTVVCVASGFGYVAYTFLQIGEGISFQLCRIASEQDFSITADQHNVFVQLVEYTDVVLYNRFTVVLFLVLLLVVVRNGSDSRY